MSLFADLGQRARAWRANAAPAVLGGSGRLMAIEPAYAYFADGAPPLRGGDDWGRSSVPELYQRIGNIGIVVVEGTLRCATGALPPYCGFCGLNRVRAALAYGLADPLARGLAFLIESRGGDLAGVLDLADTIYAARSAKPIRAILDDTATAGAYVLASAAQLVAAPRTGSAGGCGLLVAHVSSAGALRQAGIAVTVIAHGKRKADALAELPLSAAARRNMQDEINVAGATLDATVARNRGLSPGRVRSLDGAVFLGADARAERLVDMVLAPDQAIEQFVADLRPRTARARAVRTSARTPKRRTI